MAVAYKKLESLLEKTGGLVKEHIEDTRAKGEDFNVFSILGMETHETKTHSAFIVALLNPKENHYCDAKFLELFLKEIGYDYTGENLMLVKVKAEHHLGKITQDYSSGGFIDILISFPSGKAIAIENKINAGDQQNQLFRYSLYKGGASTLYYLNLTGTSPSEKSLLTLTDKDFEVISYDNQILKWLEQCLLVTMQGSIVENAIKQYQILIKKLTNTMSTDLENTLKELITKNLEEAKYIHSHYQKAVDIIREKLRDAIIQKLNNEQNKVVKARIGVDITKPYAQIWLSSDALHSKGVQFGIEPFSGKGSNNGRMFIGILDKGNSYNILEDGDYRLNTYWPVIRDLKTPDNNPLNLASTTILEKLSNDEAYFKEMVKEITQQTKAFVNSYHPLF